MIGPIRPELALQDLQDAFESNAEWDAADQSARRTHGRTSGERCAITSSPTPGPGRARCAGWSPEPRSRRSSSWTLRTIRSREHHTLGGRKVSALDPSLLGLPVLPFAVMAEMTAQVAALVVTPGLVLTGLKPGSSSQVGALRRGAGLPRAARPSCAVDRRRPRLGRHLQSGHWTARRRPRDRCSRRSRSSASLSCPRRRPAPGRWRTPVPASSRPESVYGEQWLFHGPLFQAIAAHGQALRAGDRGNAARAPLGAAGQAGSAGDCSTPT